MFSGETTANCSNEYGCSGSFTSLMWLKISYASIGSLFLLLLLLLSFEYSFSARLRNEIVGMDLVVLTRGLALSNCAVFIVLWNEFPTKNFFFYGEIYSSKEREINKRIHVELVSNVGVACHKRAARFEKEK